MEIIEKLEKINPELMGIMKEKIEEEEKMNEQGDYLILNPKEGKFTYTGN